MVRTAFVAFVDSDMVLTPETVTTLLKHFADPRTAIVVPRITGLHTAQSGSWIGRYEQARSSLDRGARPASVRPGSYVSWVSTACLIARVSAVDGGFDDEMRVGEDVDFGWRAVSRGWRVRFEPSVEAAHEHRTRFDDWFIRKVEYGTGAHPLAQRHPRAVAPAIMPAWSTALALAVLAQRRWSIAVTALVFGTTALRISRKLGIRHSGGYGLVLAAGGAANALQQVSALVTRHWWPVTVVGCVFSRRVRRVAAVAAVADIVLEYGTQRVRGGTTLDPFRYALARRLDDVAYGAGVWMSALRGRSVAALRPRMRR